MKLISFPKPTKIPPKKSIVRELEGLLERAKNGEIQNYAIFGSTNDSCTFYQYNIKSDVMPILGELEVLKLNIISKYVKQ